jgi:hypothetical protein
MIEYLLRELSYAFILWRPRHPEHLHQITTIIQALNPRSPRPKQLGPLLAAVGPQSSICANPSALPHPTAALKQSNNSYPFFHLLFYSPFPFPQPPGPAAFSPSLRPILGPSPSYLYLCLRALAHHSQLVVSDASAGYMTVLLASKPP